jgi:hypothetical protein
MNEPLNEISAERKGEKRGGRKKNENQPLSRLRNNLSKNLPPLDPSPSSPDTC